MNRDETIPNDSGTSTSSWMTTAVEVYDDPLPDELSADVCVIGAGIAGLSVAYHLMRAGVSVVVLDDGPIGGGETARTSAHLSAALDDGFARLARTHGADGARLACESHRAAIDSIEAIARTHQIDCDFRRVDGYLFAGAGGDRKALEQELAAAQRAGLPGVELLERAPLTGFDSGPCLRFPDQAQLHPVAYLRGLARAFVDGGGRLHTGVHASEVQPGKPCVVTTDGKQTIIAGSVVVATNTPITSMVEFSLRQAAYRSYCIAALIAKGAVPPGLYDDTEDPYHYVRTAPLDDGDDGHELLVVGGEDHKTGQDDDPEARWARLEAWARARFPITRVASRWSGQIMEPADGVAFIGRSGGKDAPLYIVTGDSGHGLTHGAIAGLLLRELVTGRDHPWAELYDPGRSSLRGLGTAIKETLNAGARYVDWLTGADVSSVDDVPRGGGAIVRDGLHLLAVHRDERGHCHVRSARCPHLGGVVAWNQAEHTWDCPLHGSRFDALGKVVDGPANTDLAPADLADGVSDPLPQVADTVAR